MIETKSRVSRVTNSNGLLVYLPSNLTTDYLFPLKNVPCEVLVKIDENKIVITPVEVNA